MGYNISETDDFQKLSRLYYDSGLEIEVGQDPPGRVVKHWECTGDDGELLAGATLLYKGDCCVFEYLSVKEKMRRHGIGRALIDIVTEEARRSGAETLWLCGKVPAYYRQYGWEAVDEKPPRRFPYVRPVTSSIHHASPRS